MVAPLPVHCRLAKQYFSQNISCQKYPIENLEDSPRVLGKYASGKRNFQSLKHIIFDFQGLWLSSYPSFRRLTPPGVSGAVWLGKRASVLYHRSLSERVSVSELDWWVGERVGGEVRGRYWSMGDLSTAAEPGRRRLT